MRRRQPTPRRWRGQRPVGQAVERVAACAFAGGAAPAETTARALGATWIWTTGRPRLSQTFAGLGPQAAEVRERVDAGRVAAFECDLERVLTDERHVSDEELFGAERLDARQAPWSAGGGPGPRRGGRLRGERTGRRRGRRGCWGGVRPPP